MWCSLYMYLEGTRFESRPDNLITDWIFNTTNNMSAILKDSGQGTFQFPLWKFYSIHFNIISQSFSPHTQAVETRQVQISVVDCRNTNNGTCTMEYCLHISINISTFTTPRNIVLILVEIVQENLTENIMFINFKFLLSLPFSWNPSVGFPCTTSFFKPDFQLISNQSTIFPVLVATSHGFTLTKAINST
jgi:hypothetical protein